MAWVRVATFGWCHLHQVLFFQAKLDRMIFYFRVFSPILFLVELNYYEICEKNSFRTAFESSDYSSRISKNFSRESKDVCVRAKDGQEHRIHNLRIVKLIG